MKKFTIIASLVVTAFVFNVQAKDTNFVSDAKDTALNGLFSSNGSDSYWPKLAITLLNYSGENCLNAKATIWRSENQKQIIPSFQVCSERKVGGAKLATFVGNFENQTDFLSSTGESRTEGPFPPDSAATNRFDSAIFYELALITNWGKGEVDTNFWIVNELNK